MPGPQFVWVCVVCMCACLRMVEYVSVCLCADMLREGDELLEVNGISVMGKRTDEIIRLMVWEDLPKI